jgi:hypothetical protein
LDTFTETYPEPSGWGLDVGLISYVVKIKLSRNSRKGDVMDPEIHSDARFAASSNTNVQHCAQAKIHITVPMTWSVLGAKRRRTAKAVSKKGEFRGDVTSVAVT